MPWSFIWFLWLYFVSWTSITLLSICLFLLFAFYFQYYLFCLVLNIIDIHCIHYRNSALNFKSLFWFLRIDLFDQPAQKNQYFYSKRKTTWSFCLYIFHSNSTKYLQWLQFFDEKKKGIARCIKFTLTQIRPRSLFPKIKLKQHFKNYLWSCFYSWPV